MEDEENTKTDMLPDSTVLVHLCQRHALLCSFIFELFAEMMIEILEGAVGVQSHLLFIIGC